MSLDLPLSKPPNSGEHSPTRKRGFPNKHEDPHEDISTIDKEAEWRKSCLQKVERNDLILAKHGMRDITKEESIPGQCLAACVVLAAAVDTVIAEIFGAGCDRW